MAPDSYIWRSIEFEESKRIDWKSVVSIPGKDSCSVSGDQEQENKDETPTHFLIDRKTKGRNPFIFEYDCIRKPTGLLYEFIRWLNVAPRWKMRTIEKATWNDAYFTTIEEFFWAERDSCFKHADAFVSPNRRGKQKEWIRFGGNLKHPIRNGGGFLVGVAIRTCGVGFSRDQ